MTGGATPKEEAGVTQVLEASDIQARRVVFFGTDELSFLVLKRLIDAGINICLVVTKPDVARGRGKKVSAPPVKELATAHGLPVFQPIDRAELIKKFEGSGGEVGVLCSYGRIIPDEVLAHFAPGGGILNIHPSLLPRYRGPSPVETAILNGDIQTGVSIIRLVREMDAGPVLAQEMTEILPDESKASLYTRLGNLGLDLMISILGLENLPEGAAQDETLATYCGMFDKSMSVLSPDEKTASQLHNEVRAFLGFPKSKYEWFGVKCTVALTRVADDFETELDLLCADGRYLVIERLVPENGREMGAAEFLRGVRK